MRDLCGWESKEVYLSPMVLLLEKKLRLIMAELTGKISIRSVSATDRGVATGEKGSFCLSKATMNRRKEDQGRAITLQYNTYMVSETR